MPLVGIEILKIEKDKDGHYIGEGIDIRTNKKVSVILTGESLKELKIK